LKRKLIQFETVKKKREGLVRNGRGRRGEKILNERRKGGGCGQISRSGERLFENGGTVGGGLSPRRKGPNVYNKGKIKSKALGRRKVK